MLPDLPDQVRGFSGSDASGTWELEEWLSAGWSWVEQGRTRTGGRDVPDQAGTASPATSSAYRSKAYVSGPWQQLPAARHRPAAALTLPLTTIRFLLPDALVHFMAAAIRFYILLR